MEKGATFLFKHARERAPATRCGLVFLHESFQDENFGARRRPSGWNCIEKYIRRRRRKGAQLGREKKEKDGIFGIGNV